MQFDWTISVGNILTMLAFLGGMALFLIGIKFELKYFRKEFDAFCDHMNSFASNSSRRIYKIENRLDRFVYRYSDNDDNGGDDNGSQTHDVFPRQNYNTKKSRRH